MYLYYLPHFGHSLKKVVVASMLFCYFIHSSIHIDTGAYGRHYQHVCFLIFAYHCPHIWQPVLINNTYIMLHNEISSYILIEHLLIVFLLMGVLLVCVVYLYELSIIIVKRAWPQIAVRIFTNLLPEYMFSFLYR